SIVDLAVDVAKLRNSKKYDDQHQYDGLCGRRADIKSLEACVVNLVDQYCSAFARATLGCDVDDGKGVEKGIDDIDHQQEKRRGRQQRKHNRPETSYRSGPVNGSRFDQ